MFYRLPRTTFSAQRADHGASNRAALRDITARGEVPGILAYEHETPVGWCSIAPRDEYPTLDHSPLSRRRDGTPVWSLVCFYVGRAHRRHGMMAFLVRAAVAYVGERGGGVIEAYPRRDADRFVAGSGWVGLLPVFEAAGFVEVAQPSAGRSIVRRTVSPAPEAHAGDR
jgi:hypothetical protein